MCPAVFDVRRYMAIGGGHRLSAHAFSVSLAECVFLFFVAQYYGGVLPFHFHGEVAMVAKDVGYVEINGWFYRRVILLVRPRPSGDSVRIGVDAWRRRDW